MKLILVVCLSGIAVGIADRHAFTSTVEPTIQSRIIPIQSIVHFDTPAMDPVACRVCKQYRVHDEIEYQGSLYSQKAPGPILMGVPVYWAWLHILDADVLGINLTGKYLGLTLVWIPLLFGLFFLSKSLYREFGQEALLIPVIFLGATPLYLYSNMFTDFGIALALLIGLTAAVERGSLLMWALAGFLGGWVLITNYLAGACGGIISIVYLWHHYKLNTGRTFWRISAAFAGAIPALVAFGLYNEWVWGTPFTHSYAHLTGPAVEMHRNMHFTFSAFLEGFVGERYGIFTYMPWAVVSLVGLFAMWKQGGILQTRATVGLLILGSTSLFKGWYTSTNPDMLAFCRHTMFVWPWLIMGLIYFLKLSTRKWVNSMAWGAVVYSLFITTMVGWTYPLYSTEVPSHLFNIQMSMFTGGIHLPSIFYEFPSASAQGLVERPPLENWFLICLSTLLLLIAFTIAIRRKRGGEENADVQ